MATFRETPYAAFNFLVAMDGIGEDSAQGGFTEIAGLSRSVDVIRYRAGNDRTLAPRLIPGLARFGDVTLKRGLIGSLELHEWLNEALNGRAPRRSATISLLLEDRSGVAQQWRLRNALPVAMVGPTLDAGLSAVAIESLTLAVEGVDVV